MLNNTPYWYTTGYIMQTRMLITSCYILVKCDIRENNDM